MWAAHEGHSWLIQPNSSRIDSCLRNLFIQSNELIAGDSDLRIDGIGSPLFPCSEWHGLQDKLIINNEWPWNDIEILPQSSQFDFQIRIKNENLESKRIEPISNRFIYFKDIFHLHNVSICIKCQIHPDQSHSGNVWLDFFPRCEQQMGRVERFNAFEVSMIDSRTSNFDFDFPSFGNHLSLHKASH